MRCQLSVVVEKMWGHNKRNIRAYDLIRVLTYGSLRRLRPIRSQNERKICSIGTNGVVLMGFVLMGSPRQVAYRTSVSVIVGASN